MRSDILLLNENEDRIRVLNLIPLLRWEELSFRFLPKRSTIVEYFCLIHPALSTSTLEVEEVGVETLFGTLSWIHCSGIVVGLVAKIPRTLRVRCIGETLLVSPKVAVPSQDTFDIEVSLPEFQVITRGGNSMFVIVGNKKAEPRI